MKIEVELKGMEGVLDTLKSLPPEMVSKRGGVVLRALRKGAKLIQKQAQTNFIRQTNSPGKTGINWGTGFTEKHIITRRGKLQRGIKGERVVVTVKSVLHPSGNKYGKRLIKSNDVAFMKEYGTSKQQAEPWIRPAFSAKAEMALSTVEAEMLRQIDLVVRKLAAKNKGK